MCAPVTCASVFGSTDIQACAATVLQRAHDTIAQLYHTTRTAAAPLLTSSDAIFAPPTPVHETTTAPAPLPTPRVLGVSTTTLAAPTTVVHTTYITQTSQPDASLVSITTLTQTLAELKTELLARIASSPSIIFSGAAPSTPVSFATFAQSSKIDTLSGTALSNISVSGVAGLTDADIPNSITASNYLPLAGGTLTGDLTLTGTFIVTGTQTLSGALTIPYLIATSTTASSTLQNTGILGVLAVGNGSASTTIKGNNATSTFSGGIDLTRIKTSATSTFAGIEIASGGLTIGSLSGFLKATAGAIGTSLVSLTSDISGILGIANGGTGWSTLQANTLLLGNGSGQLATTSQGTNGQTLALVNGVPTWTATTTLATISGTLAISSGGTATTTFYNGGIIFSDGTKLTQSAAAANLYWDETNKFLGIGTSTPWAKLAVNPVAGDVNQFVVGSSSATSFIINNAGNVGVGTTSPLGKLDIYGGYVSAAPNADDANNGFVVGISGTNGTNKPSATSAMAKLYITGGNTAHAGSLDLRSGSAVGSTINMYAVSGAQTIKFNTDSTSYINGGNVGIGTTSPGYRFSIDNGSTGYPIQLYSTNQDNVIRFQNAGAGGRTYHVGSTGNSSGAGNGFSIYDVTGNASRLLIDPNGNVGIGTTSPQVRLHISSTDQSISRLRIENTGSGGKTWDIVGGLPAANNMNFSIYDFDAAATRLTIDSSGNVGINQTSPSGTLEVHTGTNANLVSFYVGSGNSGFESLNDAHNAQTLLDFYGSTVTIHNTSDARLKTNVNDLSETQGLSAIMQLRPVTFNWLDAAQNSQVGMQRGFIAQEVQRVFPSLVSTSTLASTTIMLADGTQEIISSPLTLNYEGLITPMVKAIQDLNFNLKSIASTTATSTPESQSFASSFFANLFARIAQWLADAGNGITEIFAQVGNFHKVNADEVCVKKSDGNTVCVNGDQISNMLNALNTPVSTPAPTSPAEQVLPDVSPDTSIAPTTTDNTAPQ